jgi:hypothetical protein
VIKSYGQIAVKCETICRTNAVIMASSGEIWLLGKIAELANRCGVSPAIADIEIKLQFPKDAGYYYLITGVDGCATSSEEQAKVEKFWSLLGLDGSGCGRAENLGDIETIVNRALALVPQSRVRAPLQK